MFETSLIIMVVEHIHSSITHQVIVLNIVYSEGLRKKIVNLISHVAPQQYESGVQLFDQEEDLDVHKADQGNDQITS